MPRPYKRPPGGQCRLAAVFALISWAKNSLSGLKIVPATCLALAFFCGHLVAAEPVAAPATAGTATKDSPAYNVQSYVIEGKTLLSTNILIPLFSKHTGTNISVEEIVRAAGELSAEYRRQGYPTMNIIIAQKRITNGIVTMGVFPGAIAQIVVSGNRYLVSSDGVAVAANPAVVSPSALPQKTAATGTTTNVGPRFTVEKYLVAGNSVLSPQVIGLSLTNAAGAFGTNVSLDGIRSAANELQGAYRTRGYVTVAVGLPPQKLTNATVKVQVTEGRLASIEVKGNHYFSSNNVMRALPSLHTNIILNGLVFQAELNRANANQDRQIYPIIDPGPDPGTSDLTLKVKDRLPLHAKVELNNQSSPGTPSLRVNSSVVYNNLWQEEQSMGIQYSFSPEAYKTFAPDSSSLDRNEWNFYDRPLVANYSAFYRMPLGRPEAVEDAIASHPGSFGYNEATRKFNLPPSSGQPELNFFASRSTIDTGLSTVSSQNLYNTNGNSLVKNDVQEELTENNDLGFRLSLPLKATADFHSGFSGGLDFKTYQLTVNKTNVFVLTSQEITYVGVPPFPTNTVTSINNSPVPRTVSSLQYLPLTVRYDASLNGDSMGVANFGLGLNANTWYSGSRSNLQGQNLANSKQASGFWVVLNPSFSWQFPVHTNWMTTLRADGQWASEPLISNEQFGVGGVNSVRGYHEGQTFGDTGWHVSLEQQTPAHLVGPVYGHANLIVRGLVFMDYAQVYLLDPQGRSDSVSLWGTGFGGVASIGSHWEARLMFSMPLLKTADILELQPFFNFALTAQF